MNLRILFARIHLDLPVRLIKKNKSSFQLFVILYSMDVWIFMKHTFEREIFNL